MAFATVAEFLGRISTQVASELSTPVDGAPPDEARIGRALDDATAELEGYLPRLPAAHVPSADTKRVHCLKVATYLLTLDRPGKEYEQIRNAYTDTIAFYTSAIEQAASGGSGASVLGFAESPEPVFGRPGAMKGFAP